MDYHSSIIDTLILSHLYTLIQYHDIRTGAELKLLGFDKLINMNAINDIMDYHDTYSEITLEAFNDSDELREELLTAVKTFRNELEQVRFRPDDPIRPFSDREQSK